MRQPNKAQKTRKADSKEKEKIDCHATAAAAARNDRKTAPSKKQILATTPHSHCETSAGSRGNPKKADSRRNAKNVGEQPKDSRSNKTAPKPTPEPSQAQSAKSATILSEQPKDSRILEIESGLCKPRKEIRLECLSTQRGEAIADSSPKAESSSPKPTPAQTDILTCLANLSTDEVFTPPHIVNAMLDLLPQELFSDPSATFLDPACKSGVFLREIARRLMLGLEPHFPEPSERIAHILTHQLYGIAITELTALLSRRTLYGSKDVHNPTYSIPKKSGAALPQGGNIYYAPTPHSFKNAKCTYCGASQSQYDRDSTLESHAYAFIHELEPLEEFFASVKAPSPSSQAEAALSPSLRDLRQQGVAKQGAAAASLVIHKSTQVDSKAVNSASAESMDCHAANAARNDKQSHPQGDTMSFSVVIGNPPYQLITGKEASNNAVPIYNRFIQRAKELNPNHIVFIIPSRWMVGGIGLDSFRQEMINDSHIKTIIDYEDSKACFPDNNIDGGICILHREQAYTGKIDYTFTSNNGTTHTSKRTLHNPYSKFIIRNGAVLEILDKILANTQDKFSSIVSSISPFGIPTFLFNEPERFPNANLQDTPFLHSVKIYGVKGHKGGGKESFRLCA